MYTLSYVLSVSVDVDGFPSCINECCKSDTIELYVHLRHVVLSPLYMFELRAGNVDLA